MPRTYEPIATTTLSTSQATVTFSSIPGTYTDLVLVLFAKNAGGAIQVQVNNDAGNNYSRTNISGNGTTASSARASNSSAFFATASVSDYATSLLHFMNYANTTTNKTILGRGSDAAAIAAASINLWRSTAAINSIQLAGASGNIDSGSIFTLYGIKAA